MTPDAFMRHYRAVADASPVPVLLYNYPAVTGVNLTAETVARAGRASQHRGHQGNRHRHRAICRIRGVDAVDVRRDGWFGSGVLSLALRGRDRAASSRRRALRLSHACEFFSMWPRGVMTLHGRCSGRSRRWRASSRSLTVFLVSRSVWNWLVMSPGLHDCLSSRLGPRRLNRSAPNSTEFELCANNTHSKERTMLALGKSAAAAVAVCAMVACATNPATGKREFSLMSEAQEIQLGQEMDAQVQQRDGRLRRRRAAALRRRRRRCGWRARPSGPNLPWHFTVVDEPAVNAFALPGGYIYVTRGILPFLDNEAQLAGVLGHEIGHVTARHSAQQYTKATSAGVGLTLLSIFVPEAQPFQGARRDRTGRAVPEVRTRRRAAGGPAGRAVHRAATGWDPARRRRHAPDAGAARRGERQHGEACRTGCRRIPAPADRVAEGARVHRANRSAVGDARPSARTKPIPASDRRHHLRRQPERRHRARQSVPASGAAAGRHVSAEAGRCGTAHTQVVAKAPDRENYMLLQLVPQAPRLDPADCAQARWPMPASGN